MRWRRLFQGIAVAAVAMLFASACLSEEGGGGGGSNEAGEGDGQVEILFGFGGDQSKGFQDGLNEWAQANGVTIKFSEASQSFDTIVRTRVQGNNLPDIALFPQPGVMMDIANSGKMQDLSGVIDKAKVESTLVPGELAAGTSPDGKLYGVPMSMNVKSLVFYPKKAFEAKGYQIPTTLAELETLSNQIKSDGTTPWCVGIESAAATGWPATDWIEDMMLRVGGPEKYDQWVKHEIPFNDPVVVQAAQQFENLALADGNVFGGRKAVVSNAFSTAANPMFQDPPKCLLHRQGNFITQKGFFPEKVRQNLDEEVGVFYLPGTDANTKPVLGGGDLAGAFSNDEDTKKVMAHITSPEFEFADLAASSWISPHKTFDVSKYPDETTKTIAGIAYESTVFRFDGSDQMPGAVGAGSFWKGMTAWISGQQDLNEALTSIEESWPS
jgi:alpha-glucoside transport system substrate-binding protein